MPNENSIKSTRFLGFYKFCATYLYFSIIIGILNVADVFHIFINKMGTVNPWLNEDIKGILCLYEASYLSVEGENILEEARDFTRNFLEEYLERTVDQNDLTAIINHAMELPLHWRMLRLEARWFIDVYERSQGMNPILLELAKLDYNMVQATYQEDLKHASM